MNLFDSFGPLIDSGQFNGFTYEVRGTDLPILYVYDGSGTGKATQLGDSPAEALARQIASELTAPA